MKPKDLASLNDIASMIRDREMAELARLNLHKRRLEDEREQIAKDLQTAWQEGAANLMLAKAAESYEKWAQQRLTQIGNHLEELHPLIAAQKQRTAAATGRHRNLEEISKGILADQKKSRLQTH